MKKIAFLIILSGCVSLFYPPSVVHMQSNLAVPQTRPTVDLANDPRVPWLRKNAVNIRSVDPSDTDFSDLMPLKKAIGDAQVVMLAEGTHFDGTTDLARARLIKFLHEKMGFDVIAFESGFYDVNRAWQDIQAGEDVEKAITTSVFGVLSRKEEFRPTMEYIKSQAKTKDPLEITGFDSQLTGVQTPDHLVADLRLFFKEIGLHTNALDEGSGFAKQLVGMGNLAKYTAPDQSFMDTLADLRKRVRTHVAGKKQSRSVAFGIQLLESIDASARQVIPMQISWNKSLPREQRDKAGLEAFRVRDEQMARNFLWLAQGRYKKKKIIYTAHSAHTIYSAIWTTDPILKDDENVKRTGFWIHEAMGKKAYSIGFTAYEGTWGRVGDDPKLPRAIVSDQRPTVELEELFHAAGMEYAFINLRNPAKGGSWLWEPIAARAGGNHTAIEGRWNTAFDGIFYMREMRQVNPFRPVP